MKKLLFVLLIVALASYLFVGCIPVTPTEGEGEVEGEVEGVTVAIADSAKVGDYTYVSAGPHDITVTFPAPVAGLVSASISPCSGDYTKAFIADGTSVVLFPDATRKIWTGSGTFTASASGCCASYVEVNSGECSDVVCIAFPVIVDGGRPYALIEVDVANCECDGCAINFSSTSTDPDCAESELCCGDDCSGLASWAINLYNGYPFDVCCDPTVCEEPIASGSGVCPIDFTTVCLTAGTYYAVVNLVDNVGLEQNYYAKIVVSGGTANTSDCSIVVTEGFEAVAPDCVTWATNPTATIGACTSVGPQPGGSQVTLIMAVAGAGSGTTNPAVGTYTLSYDYGEVVDISTLANTDSVFTGWSANVTAPGSAATTVTMNGDQTVTAAFDLTDENHPALGPEVVDLGTAGTLIDSNFVILSKAGITDTGGHASVITGNIGSSPITAAAMDGVWCSEITGTIYGVDAAYTGSGSVTCFAGTPADKTVVDNAILDMMAAYNDIAGRPNPTAIELGDGNIGGKTLAPGLYKWSTDVIIPTDVTLSGGANDVWIFQIAGDLNIASKGDVASGIKVLLSGGAQASNVFWQVGGPTGATLGTYSTFNGTILSAKQIIIQTGAVLNGRAWAQSQVTLDNNTVVHP